MNRLVWAELLSISYPAFTCYSVTECPLLLAIVASNSSLYYCVCYIYVTVTHMYIVPPYNSS